jgi:predicted transcriptional regulator
MKLIQYIINFWRDFAAFLLNFEIVNIYTDADFSTSRSGDIEIVDKVAVYDCTNDDKFNILNFINDFASFLRNFVLATIYTEADFSRSRPGDIRIVDKVAVYNSKLDAYSIFRILSISNAISPRLCRILKLPQYTLRPTFRGQSRETSE